MAEMDFSGLENFATTEGPEESFDFEGLEEMVTPVPAPKEEEGAIDFLTTPRETSTPSQTATAEAKLAEEKKATFSPDQSIQLENSLMPNKAFTNESLKAYRDRRVAEGEKSKQAINDELVAQGATPTDLSDLDAMRRGVTAPTDVSGENIVKPIKRGLAELGAGLSQVGLDIADFLGIEVADEQEALDLAKAELEVRTQDYENKYGPNSAGGMLQTGTRHIPMAAMMAFNPTSVSKLMLGESSFQYADARGQRFDKAQAGAQALVVGTVVGTVGKLAKSFENIAQSRFTTIDEMPPEFKKHIETIKTETGLDDAQIEETIQAYKTGTESGQLTLEDAIRGVAETGNQRATGLIHQAIDQSPEAATAVIKATTARSKEVEKALKAGPLADAFKKNTRFDKGSQATNWPKVYEDALAKGVPELNPIMAQIKKNAEIFDQYDMAAYMKANRPIKADGSLDDILPDAGTRSSFRGQRDATMITIIKSAFRKVLPSNEQKLVGVIEKSLKEGKIQPEKLKLEIKQADPALDSTEIDEAVEAAINSVKTGGRTPNLEPSSDKGVDEAFRNRAEGGTLEVDRPPEVIEPEVPITPEVTTSPAQKAKDLLDVALSQGKSVPEATEIFERSIGRSALPVETSAKYTRWMKKNPNKVFHHFAKEEGLSTPDIDAYYKAKGTEKPPLLAKDTPDKLNADKVQSYIGDKKGADHTELDKSLKNIEGDYEGPAIRGMISQDLAKLDVGETYKTKGVTSIAKDKNTASQFANEEFQGKKGPKVFIEFQDFKSKPVNLGKGNQLGFDDVIDKPTAGAKGTYIEDEVVIPSNRKFEVVEKKVENGEVLLIVKEK